MMYTDDCSLAHHKSLQSSDIVAWESAMIRLQYRSSSLDFLECAHTAVQELLRDICPVNITPKILVKDSHGYSRNAFRRQEKSPFTPRTRQGFVHMLASTARKSYFDKRGFLRIVALMSTLGN
eukprot:6458388-Amphidinium_carterae.1